VVRGWRTVNSSLKWVRGGEGECSGGGGLFLEGQVKCQKKFKRFSFLTSSVRGKKEKLRKKRGRRVGEEPKGDAFGDVGILRSLLDRDPLATWMRKEKKVGGGGADRVREEVDSAGLPRDLAT